MKKIIDGIETYAFSDDLGSSIFLLIEHSGAISIKCINNNVLFKRESSQKHKNKVSNNQQDFLNLMFTVRLPVVNC